MLYVRAPDQRTSNLVHKHLCDFEETRIELIDFLTTERNLQEAYNVLVYPLHAELPTDLKTAIVQKGKNTYYLNQFFIINVNYQLAIALQISMLFSFCI